MNPDQSQHEEMQALRQELDHFIRLSQIQAEQLKRYQKLQQRSHQLIHKLRLQLKEPEATKNSESISFRK